MGIRSAWKALWGAETKFSSTGPLLSLHHLGRPVWTPRDYAAIADAGYQRQVISSRCVDVIAQAVGSVEWALFRGPDQETAVEGSHPLLQLLRRPNPIMGGSEFFTTMVSYLLIAGNEYIEQVGPDFPSDAPPRELWPLRPDRMRVIAGETGLPAGFRYSVAGKHRDWEVDPITGEGPILHLRRFHPLNDFYGMSPLEPALNAIDIRNEADRWNKALLQNSARPSGALSFSPDADSTELGDEQWHRLTTDLEERMTGPSNAGRPPVLEGKFQWLEMGLSPKDMDWIEAKNLAGRDMCTSLGVPPMLAGIQGDQTFANFREARLALWEETVIPLVRYIRDDLNNWLTPAFGDDLRLMENLDAIPALTLRRERTFEMLQQADYLMINEKRKASGFDEIEGGDVIVGPLTTGVLLGEGANADEGNPQDEDEARGLVALPEGGLSRKRADQLNLLAYGDAA